MKAIKVPIIISSISSKVDRSAGFRVSTPELSDEEFSALRGLQNLNLMSYIEPTEETISDVQEVQGELESKTPSQRLRNSIWRWWESKGKPGGSNGFNDFYLRQMDNLIEQVKSKIDI